MSGISIIILLIIVVVVGVKILKPGNSAQNPVNNESEKLQEEKYCRFYENYRKGNRDKNDIDELVSIAYRLAYEMPRGAINILIDDYKFWFKRADGTVFSTEDVIEGSANISEADLEVTKQWLLDSK